MKRTCWGLTRGMRHTAVRAINLAGVLLLAGLSTAPASRAQGCTTQAKMPADVRDPLSTAAMTLATAVKAGDVAKVQAGTVAEFSMPAAFAPTASLVQATTGKLTNDSLRVTQVYLLNAQNRKAGDTTDADFSCALTGTTSETDFSISGLPPGTYGFAMVEATGDHPWLLAFLMRQDAGAWKLAGFYPRARAAAGHDGLWYWNAARDRAKAKDQWSAWLLFGEADQLLRPANFATSTNLDRLRSEQRNAVPPELADGIGATTPLVVKASDGTNYSFTSIESQGSEDGKQLNLLLHLRADAGATPDAAKARNLAAAKVLLDAHKDLRQGFDQVLVFADAPGEPPVVTTRAIHDVS